MIVEAVIRHQLRRCKERSVPAFEFRQQRDRPIVRIVARCGEDQEPARCERRCERGEIERGTLPHHVARQRCRRRAAHAAGDVVEVRGAGRGEPLRR
jgi:hypothetical protein